jgi:hypothetical protein
LDLKVLPGAALAAGAGVAALAVVTAWTTEPKIAPMTAAPAMAALNPAALNLVMLPILGGEPQDHLRIRLESWEVAGTILGPMPGP